MSFDVYVGGEHVANYTSNMGAFFAWALDGIDSPNPNARCDSRDAIFTQAPRDGLVRLDGLTVSEALDRLDDALERIAASKLVDLCRFNAANGWGDVETATAFLKRIREACYGVELDGHGHVRNVEVSL